jgi:hypothetical protein
MDAAPSIPNPAHPEQSRFRRIVLVILCVQMAAAAIVWLTHNDASKPSDVESANAASLFIAPRLGALSVRPPWVELIEKSRSLAKKNERLQALKALHDAEPLVPSNPSALAEIANAFEALDANDHALEIWERIAHFGDAAGIYYVAAEAKLANAGSEAKPRSPKRPAITLSKPALKDSSPKTPGKNLLLTIPIQKAQLEDLDVKDVTIQVHFYDTLKDGSIQRTDSESAYRWADPPIDWKSGQESLEVNYVNPAKRDEKRLHGYVIALYYRNRLQDFRAEPSKLGSQFPPLRALPKDIIP